MKNKQGFTASAGAKSAFTLAETLLVLLMIGILAVFSILTLRRGDDEFGPLYYRAYEALKVANYNVYVDLYPEYKRDYPVKVSAKTDEYSKSKAWLEANPGGICQRLLEYINISEGQVNCDAQLIDPNGDDSQFDGKIGPGGHLAFKGSNSQRFYFGKGDNGGIIKTKLTASNETSEWFIIYVDLNGERGPNSTSVINGRAPDIVAFALLNQGQIAPIGLPRLERKYLTAKVAYPDTYCTDVLAAKYGCDPKAEDEEGNKYKIEKRFSNTITYYEAVKRAWGCRLGDDADDPDTIGCKEETGTKAVAMEADTIDFTRTPQVLKKIRDEYARFSRPVVTIDDKNTIQNKSPASAASDGLPGNCVANDPIGNPCKVLIEKYQK